MYMSVVVSVVFGWILLVAVTFAVPSTDFALENIGTVVPSIWAESMSQNWAEILLFVCVVAQFFCLTASVTSASRMMFAFSRDRAVPGIRSGGGSPVTECRCTVAGIGVRSSLLMVPAVWNYLVGYFVGTAISVIGLYIAFMIPVLPALEEGRQLGGGGSWSLGRHYKWLTPVGLIWVVIITCLFSAPLYSAGVPWSDDFTWDLTNYTIPWFVGIGLIFGGWWFLSAKNWFKGPVRMGTEEELERMEEEQLRRFDLPTESS